MSRSKGVLTPPSAPRERHPDCAVGRGRAVHDARGNAVWDWAIATGVLAAARSEELLRMLDDPTLSLEGDALGLEWAGDPYNRS